MYKQEEGVWLNYYFFMFMLYLDYNEKKIFKVLY